MFNALYVGESTYSMTMGKTYTVFWVDGVVSPGKTYFLVCGDHGDFIWVDKNEFTVPMNL